jgi:hypothetical protein
LARFGMTIGCAEVVNGEQLCEWNCRKNQDF